MIDKNQTLAGREHSQKELHCQYSWRLDVRTQTSKLVAQGDGITDAESNVLFVAFYVPIFAAFSHLLVVLG